MNKSSVLGFHLAFLVIYLGVLHNSPNPSLFLDPHALILVCGGTLAAALIAFPINKLGKIFDFLFLRVLFKSRSSDLEVAKDLFFIYHEQKMSGDVLLVDPNSHPFLVEIAVMLNKTKINIQDLNRLLTDRINFIKKAYLADAKILNSLAKFPPAFGLLGASTGMISMMIGLGKGGADQIGPAMAVALVATFWGIAVANLILLPLSDHATKVAAEEVHTRTMIKKAIILMLENCSQSLLLEELSGYLPIRDRRILKDYSKKLAENSDTKVDINLEKRKSS